MSTGEERCLHLPLPLPAPFRHPRSATPVPPLSSCRFRPACVPSFRRRALDVLSSPHDRPILRLAVPALAGLAADPLVSLVDTAFVGQLGRVPLAALGINASVFSMTFVIFNFLAYGTTHASAAPSGRATGRRPPAS